MSPGKKLTNPARSSLLGLTVGIIFILITGPTAASETHYLIRNKLFRSSNEAICIRGTLSYAANPRLLRLRGRVQSASGSGLLRIHLLGKNLLGHQHSTEMELSLRGNHSEIINFKMIPDYPDVVSWEIISILYELNNDEQQR